MPTTGCPVSLWFTPEPCIYVIAHFSRIGVKAPAVAHRILSDFAIIIVAHALLALPWWELSWVSPHAVRFCACLAFVRDLTRGVRYHTQVCCIFHSTRGNEHACQAIECRGWRAASRISRVALGVQSVVVFVPVSRNPIPIIIIAVQSIYMVTSIGRERGFELLLSTKSAYPTKCGNSKCVALLIHRYRRSANKNVVLARPNRPNHQGRALPPTRPSLEQINKMFFLSNETHTTTFFVFNPSL